MAENQYFMIDPARIPMPFSSFVRELWLTSPWLGLASPFLYLLFKFFAGPSSIQSAIRLPYERTIVPYDTLPDAVVKEFRGNEREFEQLGFYSLFVETSNTIGYAADFSQRFLDSACTVIGTSYWDKAGIPPKTVAKCTFTFTSMSVSGRILETTSRRIVTSPEMYPENFLPHSSSNLSLSELFEVHQSRILTLREQMVRFDRLSVVDFLDKNANINLDHFLKLGYLKSLSPEDVERLLCIDQQEYLAE